MPDASVTPNEVLGFDSTYQRYRVELWWHMKQVDAVNAQELALFIIDNGDELARDWMAVNPQNPTPSPQDYELFIRQKYLNGMRATRC